MAIEPYLHHLRHLRGISRIHVSAGHEAHSDQAVDAVLTLQTSAGKFQLAAMEYKSHLSHHAADHVIAARRRRPQHPLLILAPHVGAPLGARLAEAGLNYLDRHGNCHIAVGSLLIHVEGQKGAPQHGADKGLRSAGYQVLFAYLADPTLLDAPLRDVAELAGVSRQPVSDMRQRLMAEEYVVSTSKGPRWLERRRDDALSLWLHGYETSVRPSLVWGTYRTQKADPDVLEKQLEETFKATEVSEHRWGGSTAGYRLTRYYRGERTTVHVHSTPTDLVRRLRALPDPDGNFVLMKAFGTINWEAPDKTVHPLLVYSEMLQERSERAREAAQELFEQHIRPAWESGR